ncbi:MAG: hypothetical protein MHM6MM_001156 [Cercozoa sp. M6MM]
MNRAASESLRMLRSRADNYAARVLKEPHTGKEPRTWMDNFPLPRITRDAHYLATKRQDLTQPMLHMWQQMRQSRPFKDLVFKFADKRTLVRAPGERIYGRVNSMWRSSWGYMFSLDNLILSVLWTPVLMAFFKLMEYLLGEEYSAEKGNWQQQCNDLLAKDAEFFLQHFHEILSREPELVQMITHKYGTLSNEALTAAWELYAELRLVRGLKAVKEGSLAANMVGNTPQERLETLRRILQRVRNLGTLEIRNEFISDRDILAGKLDPSSDIRDKLLNISGVGQLRMSTKAYENRPIPMPPKRLEENKRLGQIESSYHRFPHVLVGTRWFWILLEPWMKPMPPRQPLLDILMQQGFITLNDINRYNNDYSKIDTNKKPLWAFPVGAFSEGFVV